MTNRKAAHPSLRMRISRAHGNECSVEQIER